MNAIVLACVIMVGQDATDETAMRGVDAGRAMAFLPTPTQYEADVDSVADAIRVQWAATGAKPTEANAHALLLSGSWDDELDSMIWVGMSEAGGRRVLLVVGFDEAP